MALNWAILGGVAPTDLTAARESAHHAAQWATKAARANLVTRADDSQSSLTWDHRHGALVSQPMGGNAVRIGLRLFDLTLLAMNGDQIAETHGLDGQREAQAGRFVDEQLTRFGLKPASPVDLPYAMPPHPVADGAAYSVGAHGDALAELGRWFEAAADLLEAQRAKLIRLSPGPSPVRCWPHHFDIATLVGLEDGEPETARAIGIGMTPGDEAYAQPYFYINPWPNLDADDLPALPPPGQWHRQGFVGAVATAEQVLGLADRRDGLTRFVDAAVAGGREKLGV